MLQDAEVGKTGRSRREWEGFILGCFSVIMIVFGALFECPGVPSLNAFCITFGVINFGSSALPFIFRTDRHERGLDTTGWSGEAKKLPPWVKPVGAFSGVALILCTIWSAVIVFSNLSYFGGPNTLEQAIASNVTNPEGSFCNSNVITMGLVATVLPWAVILFMLVVFLVKKAKAKKS